MIFEICKCTDGHIDTVIAILCTAAVGKVTSHARN